MKTFDEFKQFIKEKIQSIEQEYKESYKDYEPTENERKLERFLDDVWGIRFEDENKNDSLKNASVQISFIDKENPNNFLDKNFRIAKLHPKQKKTTPLYYLIFRLSECKDYHFYFCPNIYFRTKQRCQNLEQNIVASNCFFVDIDKTYTKKPIYNCSEEEILEYLKCRYPAYSQCQPSYILMSGGGLHLYFSLTYTEYLYGNRYYNRRRREHRELTGKLITVWEADVACKNMNRLLRTPYSYNMKYGIRTRFFTFPEQVKKYDSETLRQILESCLPDKEPEKVIEQPKPKDKPVKEQARKRENIHTTEEERSKIATKAKKALYLSRRNDLEKWFFSHLKDMDGRRHKFFLIYVIVLKNLNSKEDYIIRQCHSLNDMLEAPLPERELEKTFLQKKWYLFKNETIAEWLEFTQMEIAGFECHYGKEAIQEYHRERSRYYRELEKEKRKEEIEQRIQEEEEKKKRYFAIIEENPEISLSKLAKLLGCHKSSAFRWKKKYEEEKES